MEMKGLYRAYEIEQKEAERQRPGSNGITDGDREAFGEFAKGVNNTPR